MRGGCRRIRTGERAVQTPVIENPGRLAHDAVDPRRRIGARFWIQHDRADPGQSQFARHHQPIRAGPAITTSIMAHLASSGGVQHRGKCYGAVRPQYRSRSLPVTSSPRSAYGVARTVLT